jgi:hypothetical protein
MSSGEELSHRRATEACALTPLILALNDHPGNPHQPKHYEHNW